MASTNPITRLGGLARRLVQDGLLSEEDANLATEESGAANRPLISHLVSKGLVQSQDAAIAASQEYGVPLFDLAAIDTDHMPRDLVEEKLVRKHHALPLIKRGNRLFLAVSDPTNHQGLDEIKFHTGLTTDAVLVEEDKLSAAIESMLEAQDTTMSDLLDEDLENLDISSEDDDNKERESNLDVDDAPVVRYVNKILLDAINSGTSDIHFEPYEKTYRVRFRQDGMLHEKATPPINIAARLAARLKVMARMNIAERRVPQDGRIKMNLSRNRSIDFRVNTCRRCTARRWCCVSSIPRPPRSVSSRWASRKSRKNISWRPIKKPYGMILVTGPTGSGKTVTLYTALNLLNDPEVNISTAEDPVEIQVAGHQPGQRQPTNRTDLCRGAARLSAPGPGHRHGR